MRRLVILACAVAMLVGAAQVAPAGVNQDGRFSDEAVAQAITRGIEFFYKTQNAAGHWGEGGEYGNPTGESAFVIYALLAAGLNPQSDPPVTQALKWLAATETKGTYALGIRCNVWHLANQTTLGKYQPQLKKDASILIGRPVDGAYGYTGKGPEFGTQFRDLSNTQYGVLGVWAAAADGLEIPYTYWPSVIKCFEVGQLKDEGWGYYPRPGSGFGYGPGGTSTMTMTTAGVASLLVCYDYSGVADENPGKRFESVQRGLGWMEKNFKIDIGPFTLYNLYGIERVGLAAGYKFFGTHDWYKEGAEYLLKTQAADGSWSCDPQCGGQRVGTAYALLFLIRGRHPVLFNKLQHGGDWDRRSRDLAAVTRWVSRNLETTVNWQIVRTDNAIDDWHDASILYITGTTDPKFTPEQLEKVKQYVEQGGTLFTVVQQGGGAFKQAMASAYQKMFPEYPIQKIDADSALYNSYFTVSKFSQFSEITNGARPLVVHCDEDLAARWSASRALVSPNHREFQLAYNVSRYALGKTSDLPARGHVFWPKDAKAAAGAKSIDVYRIKYNGRWNPEPRAWARFKDMMADRENIVINLPEPIALTKLSPSVKVAHMTGSASATFSDDEARIVGEFVNGGGTLIIDSAGGNVAFTASVESLLQRALPRSPLTTLSPVAPMFALPGRQIDRCGFRMATAVKIRQHNPQFKCVVVGAGRAGVIFSPLDLTCGLIGCRAGVIDGYDLETSFKLMRNLVIYANDVQTVPGGDETRTHSPLPSSPKPTPQGAGGPGGAF